MVVMILSFLLSLIPTAALFYWLRSLRRNDVAYRTLCGKALIVFFAKARKNARYTEPLRETGAGSAWPEEAWKP